MTCEESASGFFWAALYIERAPKHLASRAHLDGGPRGPSPLFREPTARKHPINQRDISCEVPFRSASDATPGAGVSQRRDELLHIIPLFYPTIALRVGSAMFFFFFSQAVINNASAAGQESGENTQQLHEAGSSCWAHLFGPRARFRNWEGEETSSRRSLLKHRLPMSLNSFWIRTTSLVLLAALSCEATPKLL